MDYALKYQIVTGFFSLFSPHFAQSYVVTLKLEIVFYFNIRFLEERGTLILHFTHFKYMNFKSSVSTI